MSILDNLYYKVLMRVGLRADLPALDVAEPGLATDTATVFVGDGTTTPMAIPTTKSTESFDFTKSAKMILPGGIVFDKTQPGTVNGVDLRGLNQGNGIIIRTGDNRFVSGTVTSDDDSLVVDGGNGGTGSIDLALNLNNPALLSLISAGGYILYYGSTPPNNPLPGSDFFDSDEDILYKRIGDSSTGCWVDFSS